MSSTHSDGNSNRRRSSETKDSLKTTELMAYLGCVLAVALAALMVGADENGGGDPFGALDALRLITWLTIGYMVARGLAKAGTREKYQD